MLDPIWQSANQPSWMLSHHPSAASVWKASESSRWPAVMQSSVLVLRSLQCYEGEQISFWVDIAPSHLIRLLVYDSTEQFLLNLLSPSSLFSHNECTVLGWGGVISSIPSEQKFVSWCSPRLCAPSYIEYTDHTQTYLMKERWLALDRVDPHMPRPRKMKQLTFHNLGLLLRVWVALKDFPSSVSISTTRHSYRYLSDNMFDNMFMFIT